MILKTQRLVLRPMVEGDAPALFAILGDSAAMRFWHRPPVARLAVVEEMVREQIAARERFAYWTAWRDSDAIGSCDLSLIDRSAGSAEAGFLFRRDQWGQGFATEAMAALCGHALEGIGLECLTARTRPENEKARRVLERLGFAFEGVVRGYQPTPDVRMDCALYALRRQSISQKGA